jgi:hypothetical protein
VGFSFTAPSEASGVTTVQMTAVANEERAFEETDYSNNTYMASANIAVPIIPEECSTTVTWTEADSHTETYEYSYDVTVVGADGSESVESRTETASYECGHIFVYRATLTTTATVKPETLKSGYGFEVDVKCSVSTPVLISNVGGCSEWGNGRSATTQPTPPTSAQVIVPWTMTNRLGTQHSIITLGQDPDMSNTTRISYFAVRPNPASEIRAPKIYTPVELEGIKTRPDIHHFNIKVAGGGVGGSTFCETITKSITINGSMYEDDITGATRY